MSFFKSRDGMARQSLSDTAWNSMITIGWVVGLPVLCWVAASIGYNL